MKRNYAITGATGNTGHIITKGLLGKGHTVRIISRNTAKSSEFIRNGGVLFKGSALDKGVPELAFKGADAVYILIPVEMTTNDFFRTQQTNVDNLVNAIRNNNVKYVVALSSIGADYSEGNGVVQGLNYMEQQLNEIEGLNAIYLRATSFMENLLGMAGLIAEKGMIAAPYDGDVKFPMIASQDIGNEALNHLEKLDFQGKNFKYLLGQRDISYNEIAHILSGASGGTRPSGAKSRGCTPSAATTTWAS